MYNTSEKERDREKSDLISGLAQLTDASLGRDVVCVHVWRIGRGMNEVAFAVGRLTLSFVAAGVECVGLFFNRGLNRFV